MLPIELIMRFVPSPAIVLTVAPIAAAVAGAAALFVAALARRGVRTAYTRKIFHFTIFTVAGAVHLAWQLPGVVVFGAVVSALVLYAVARGDGHAFYEALARAGDAPRRTLFIIVPLVTTALGGVLANVLFPAWAFVGYLVCGWGDAAGEPIGSRWGRHRYSVPSFGGVRATRSIEGSAGVLGIGALAALLGLLAAGVPAGTALGAAAACGVAGAAVEAVSTHGLDNLTVQLAAAAMAWLVLG
jgi:phytol kinase